MKKLFLAITVTLVLYSCSKPLYVVDAFPHGEYDLDKSNINSTLDLDLNITYGGDALDYYIFQLDAKNHDDEAIYITSRDIDIEFKEDPQQIKSVRFDALSKNSLLFDLEEEKIAMQKEKRRGQIGNAIFTGLGLLASIFSGNPVYAAEVILESSSVMIEDQRFYKFVSEDIDQQIEYVEDWVLEDVTLLPGESASYDLLFEAIDKPIYSEVILTIKEEKYIFPFDMLLRKVED